MNTKFKVGDRVSLTGLQWDSDIRNRPLVIRSADNQAGSSEVTFFGEGADFYCLDHPQESGYEWELLTDDLVNHPAHYTGHPTIEAIDVLEHVQDYRLGTAMKYIWRVAFGGKDNNRQDIQKAVWYLNRWLERNDAVPDA